MRVPDRNPYRIQTPGGSTLRPGQPVRATHPPWRILVPTAPEKTVPPSALARIEQSTRRLSKGKSYPAISHNHILVLSLGQPIRHASGGKMFRARASLTFKVVLGGVLATAVPLILTSYRCSAGD